MRRRRRVIMHLARVAVRPRVLPNRVAAQQRRNVDGYRKQHLVFNPNDGALALDPVRLSQHILKKRHFGFGT